jgi:hypothetical protein
MFLPPAGKLQQETSLGGRRLHYMHRPPLHHRFIPGTGSDLCVFPRKLVPGRKERVNYDLFAANGTTIPTYGWIYLSLNLGLRRDFTRRFMVTDVQTPTNGLDLLAPCGILVDCRNNRLHDGTTGPSRTNAYPQGENRRRRCNHGQPLRRVP